MSERKPIFVILCEESPTSYGHLTSWSHWKRKCGCPPLESTDTLTEENNNE